MIQLTLLAAPPGAMIDPSLMNMLSRDPSLHEITVERTDSYSTDSAKRAADFELRYHLVQEFSSRLEKLYGVGTLAGKSMDRRNALVEDDDEPGIEGHAIKRSSIL